MLHRRLLLRAGLALPALAAAAPGRAQPVMREVTDQNGRTIRLPRQVTRIVVLQHHSMDVLAQLGATGQVVGVLRDWRQQLGPGFARLAPGYDKLPTPGSLTSANVEALLALAPELVILTHYAPPQMVQAIEAAGMPVAQLAFFSGPPSERGKLNPVLADEKTAYTDGLVEAIRLLGEITGRQARAGELAAAALAGRRLVESRVATLAEAARTPMYMANPELATYGRGKYTGVVMELAGGRNVARALQGFGKVTMEQVLDWNPAVVIVQDRYAAVAAQIRQDPAWAPIRAVAEGRVLVTPEYVKPWGHPAPESLALGEAWMARALHPALFADLDLAARAQDFYQRFYGVAYDGA
ncbi:ABC transporter substrate-binding protein [Roseomonas sp. 18066]|uniref:ABC transporter substrate-binding protein n=1 Tax=Roseomonas sp. 18066 TaxID=2681412 RepID=UPI001359490E|nr:ABC transporter substrate-binding protein [Roseomonas sp. 18066]